jgi:hypothetical protein
VARRHSLRQPPKSYLYISDLKVDQLFEQLPDAQRRRLSHNLKLDFKLVSYSIAESPRPEATRQARLAAVCRAIDTSEVGTVEDPQLYVRGSAPMKYGRYPVSRKGPKDVVFFVGHGTGSRLVALGGTAHHLVGSTGERPWSNSGIASLLDALRTESFRISGGVKPPRPDHDLGLPGAWPAEAAQVWREHPGPEQQVEFLALKLAVTSDYPLWGGPDVLLGSPIYVALR